MLMGFVIAQNFLDERESDDSAGISVQYSSGLSRQVIALELESSVSKFPSIPVFSTLGKPSGSGSKIVEAEMIEGSCHCGLVRWRFDGKAADSATACNCTICRRYGALWAYDFENEGIHVSGPTRAYIRGQMIEFHFCPTCGCVAFWRSQHLEAGGRLRIAVNLRLAEPEAVADIPIQRYEGLKSFEDLPLDGRCVGDYWF